MIEPFEPYEIPGKPWGTETVIAEWGDHLGKVLRYKAGHQGALQYHEHKDEAFHLFSGAAEVGYDRGDGVIELVAMKPGQTFHIPPGAPHKFTAITDCVVFEIGNRVFDDRVNCSESYGDADGNAR